MDSAVTPAGFARALAAPVPPLLSDVACGTVYRRLLDQPIDATLAVVNSDGVPIGLINRFTLMGRYAQRFVPELYERRAITAIMEPEPLIVDEATPIEELGRLVAIGRPQALVDGFIVTTARRYLGVGTGRALIHSKVARDALRTSELQQALIEAAQARTAMSQFLALMSHELRTPLNAIIGFSELIRGEMLGPVSERRYLDYAGDIHTAGSHLLALISDILDLSKAEAGRLEIRAQPMAVGEAIADCFRLVGDRAPQAGLTVIVEAPDDLPLIDAEFQKVKQMILNLLSNAIKFTPDGGRITVAATATDGEFAISVSDTGIGIAARDIPIALSPFRQIDSTLGRKAQGTGLGLPLVKTLIELHGGRLDLASEPGRGTTASVVFPAQRVLDGGPARREPSLA